MLAPFQALLPRTSGVSYADLERAAKALRIDPARYQSVAGVEYDRHPEALFRWEIAQEGHPVVIGLVGVFPLEALVPHEATTAAALTRPRHPVQIRPVMALVDEPLPKTTPLGPPVFFRGTHQHTVIPVTAGPLRAPDAVIADGHHRVAAAKRVGGDPGIMTMIVSTGGATLEAGAFHRAFAHPIDLPRSLPGCQLVDEAPEESLAEGRMAVVTSTGSVGIAVAHDAIDPLLAGIPAGVAARHVLPHLGLVEEDAVYLDDVAAALAAARYGTAILLPGSDVASVVAAARAGVALPPKATRFRPKPVRGFLMRSL